MSRSHSLINISPAHIIIASFCVLIACGTLLLSLPQAQVRPLLLIDLLFTATSATCVTGLFTIPLSSFTLFGKIVIITLVQLGALGLTTMSLFILSLFMELGIATKSMVRQMLEVESWQDIKKMLLFIATATIITEAIGIICFFALFSYHYPQEQALLFAFFHAISSFCNAGISFFQDGTGAHFNEYSANYYFMIITASLTFLGGLGFYSWHEIMEYIHDRCIAQKPFRFSLHTKIILYATTLIFLITALMFWSFEIFHSSYELPTSIAAAHTLFHAVMLKSCGFFLTSLDQLHRATLVLILLVAFIGSSPGSTGSGVKITTFVTFFCAIRATLRAREDAEIFGRCIPTDQVYKAITIISLSVCWIICTLFLLLITESQWNFFDILFETMSAFSNLGLSVKGSEHLSSLGKLIIIVTMLAGRIGSLTFILGLKLRKASGHAEFSYPEERVVLG